MKPRSRRAPLIGGTSARVASAASSPATVQPYVEHDVELEGELEVLVEDRDPGNRYLYFLQTPIEQLSVHFAGDAPALQTGARVRVKGLRVDTGLVVPR